MAAPTEMKHIVQDPAFYGGRPCIDNVKISVHDIAESHNQANAPEEIIAEYYPELTAQEAGRAGKKIADPDQLAFATGQGRVVVPEDRDFTHPDISSLTHADIVLLRRQLTISHYIDYLELLAKTTEPEDMRNPLLYCDW